MTKSEHLLDKFLSTKSLLPYKEQIQEYAHLHVKTKKILNEIIVPDKKISDQEYYRDAKDFIIRKIKTNRKQFLEKFSRKG